LTARDYLAPLSARIHLVSRHQRFHDPARLVDALLEDIARRTLAAGASMLGHIKCLAATDTGGRFYASLTDTRTGTRTAGDRGGPSSELTVELVVLVYGLERSLIAETVVAAVRDAAVQSNSRWSVKPGTANHSHSDSFNFYTDRT